MLIALVGLKGSGKDCFAEPFIKQGFQNIKMADPLKNMLRVIYHMAGTSPSIVERKLEGDLKEEPCDVLGGETPRHAMQSLGTEWRDMISRTLWSRIWKHRVTSHLKEGTPVICTDIRFLHELKLIQTMGGQLITIKRPGYEGSDGHTSETEMKSLVTDDTIFNNGTIEHLHKKANHYLKELTHVH